LRRTLPFVRSCVTYGMTAKVSTLNKII